MVVLDKPRPDEYRSGKGDRDRTAKISKHIDRFYCTYLHKIPGENALAGWEYLKDQLELFKPALIVSEAETIQLLKDHFKKPVACSTAILMEYDDGTPVYLYPITDIIDDLPALKWISSLHRPWPLDKSKSNVI
jgi:hypothetical protein